jgi:hypothetical protein
MSKLQCQNYNVQKTNHNTTLKLVSAQNHYPPNCNAQKPQQTTTLKTTTLTLQSSNQTFPIPN